MLKKFIPKLYIPIVVIITLGWGCTKLDTTTLGGDLIPIVDNVNTFADTLDITATQGIFADTTRTNLLNDHVLGTISNDPLFGTTKADIYVQFKPSFYPFRYGNLGDTLAGLDSVVLCIAYKGYWGDPSQLQNLEVKQIDDRNFSDSTQIFDITTYIPNARRISYKPNVIGGSIGNAIVDIRKLKDTIPVGGSLLAANKAKVVRQIRIKLSQSYAAGLFSNDTGAVAPLISDSNFRSIYHGLGIFATGGGNALMYTTLNDENTRLEIHFRKKNAGKIDTVFTSFRVNVTGSKNIPLSAAANNITRNRSGYPAENPTPSELYLQTTPGTYINLSIPGISTLSNRVIHRAEIVVQQIPHHPIYDTMFRVPDYVYLDLIDTTTTPNWKPIYYDLNPNTFYDPDLPLSMFPNQIDYPYYGAYRRDKIDQFGNAIRFYNINVTRHLQRIVTNRTPNYSFRLYAPYIINYSRFPFGGIPYPNNIALGRAKIGSGSNPNYKMYLRIIYSKI
ncbi:MAG: DUF4270 family protein [Ferruginibacter sp.]|nr:DUF4270 family protein [Ferruginibacter sp.]